MTCKRKSGEEDEKKVKKACVVYDFFHDKPESAKEEQPVGLLCGEEQFWLFPQIVNICSQFLSRQEAVDFEGKPYIPLDNFDARGLRVFANWAMDQQKPTYMTANEDPGNIMDDVLVCHLTAAKLRAKLLCDLILFRACEIGAKNDLVITKEHINIAYAEPVGKSLALRDFITAVIAYQQRNGRRDPFLGDETRAGIQRQDYEDTPPGFKYDLMVELSKPSASQNPCDSPKRFLLVVDYYMQKKEETRLKQEEERKQAAIRAQMERQGTRGSPLFVPE